MSDCPNCKCTQIDMSTKPQKAKVTVEIGGFVYTMELDTCDLNINTGVREVPGNGLYRKFEPTNDVQTTITGKGSKMPTLKEKDE